MEKKKNYRKKFLGNKNKSNTKVCELDRNIAHCADDDQNWRCSERCARPSRFELTCWGGLEENKSGETGRERNRSECQRQDQSRGLKGVGMERSPPG